MLNAMNLETLRTGARGGTQPSRSSVQGEGASHDASTPIATPKRRLDERKTAFFKLLLFLTLGCAATGSQVSAQELTRESMANPDATANVGSSTPSNDRTDYNLRIGPVRFLADVSAGFEYIDNINYSDQNRLSDEVVRIALNIRTIYDFSKLNAITLNLGIGYVRYLEHPDATSNDLFVTPGSQVALDVYAFGLFRFNFHDSFAVLQDPVDNASLSNVTNFGRFINTAGVTAVADLNNVVITAGYDHTNYKALNTSFNYLDRSAESLLGSISLKVAPRAFVGVEGTAAFTNYSGNELIQQNDSVGGTGGLFVDITPTPYLRVVARGGYQYTSFDSGGTFTTGRLADGTDVNPFYQQYNQNRRITDESELSDFYWSVTASNRINAYLAQSLSAGRENDFGLTSNYITVNYVRYNIAWRALSNVTLGGDLFYENDQESGGLFDEHIERYGGDVTLAYQFNLHLTGTLHYYGIVKDSDAILRDYYQNRVGLDLDYKF